MSEKDWFVDWFDTSYYHILYQNRNDLEAKKFIIKLMNHLELTRESKVLDLACGKGRHSITLNNLGYDVLGVDLSENSISQAHKFTNDSLSFAVHDMREVIPNRDFDAILNLFTSFGYFEDSKENERVCVALSQMLKPGGKLVIDFMNAYRIIDSLVEKEEKTLDGINFKISREYNGTHIFKYIKFQDKGQEFFFTERVQALHLEHFHKLLESCFEIENVFGSLDLNPFVPEKSDRLIIIATRKNEL